MAIDSAEKRQNLVGVGRVHLRTHFPQVSKDAQWRAASGIGFGGSYATGDPAAANDVPFVDGMVYAHVEGAAAGGMGKNI